MTSIFVPTSSNHIKLLFITGVLLFAPVVTFSFLIGWDDQIYVLNKYTEGGLALKNIGAILTDFYYGQYAPLNQLFYSAVFEFVGYNPAYYHVLSALIHIINALLVYIFACKITMQVLPHLPGYRNIAIITAVLFLIAPINLEPVAWIAASKVLIYALCYLGSLLWYIRYIQSGQAKYYYLMLLSFVLSFAAKEQALTLPLAMILIDYIYDRNFKKAILWFEKMPPLILSVLFVLASFQSQGRFIFISAESYTLTERTLLAFYTISEYFTKVICPVNISYVYPFPFLPGVSKPLWLWLHPICIILAFICIWRKLLKKHVLFGILFFLVHIIMVSNFVSLARHSIVADRYAYIASIGLLWLLSVTGAQLFQRAKPAGKPAIIIMLAVYCTCFFTYSSIHLWVWKNAVTLKERVRTEIINRSDYEK